MSKVHYHESSAYWSVCGRVSKVSVQGTLTSNPNEVTCWRCRRILKNRGLLPESAPRGDTTPEVEEAAPHHMELGQEFEEIKQEIKQAKQLELDSELDLKLDSMPVASSYYDVGGIATQDILKAKLTPTQYEGFLLGNMLKYLLRANYKGNFESDMEKVAVYARWLEEHTQP